MMKRKQSSEKHTAESQADTTPVTQWLGVRPMPTIGPTYRAGTHVAPAGITLTPFQKWGLDILGPFTPTAARTGNKYILVATDYYTKWVVAKPLRDNTTASTTKFLYEHIWCRSGCPIELISDQGGHFLNVVIAGLTQHYAVVHKKSTP